MLDILNMSGAAPRYPDSGPGPIELEHGNLELGFFGEVTSSELFTTNELSLAANFFDGTVYYSNPVWLKFAYQGKFLFIPKNPIKYSISWQQLYDKGLIYGIEDTTDIEVLKETHITPQFVTIDKGKFRFAIRVLKADTQNPAQNIINGYDYDRELDSEYDSLIYSVVRNLNTKFPKFAKYTEHDLGFHGSSGSRTLVREHHENLSSIWFKGYVLSYYGTTLDPSNREHFNGWRPVLEVISKDILIPQIDLNYNSSVDFYPIGGLELDVDPLPYLIMPSGLSTELELTPGVDLFRPSALSASPVESLVFISDPTERIDAYPYLLMLGDITPEFELIPGVDLLRPNQLTARPLESLQFIGDHQTKPEDYPHYLFPVTPTGVVEGEVIYKPFGLAGRNEAYASLPMATHVTYETEGIVLKRVANVTAKPKDTITLTPTPHVTVESILSHWPVSGQEYHVEGNLLRKPYPFNYDSPNGIRPIGELMVQGLSAGLLSPTITTWSLDEQ